MGPGFRPLTQARLQLGQFLVNLLLLRVLQSLGPGYVGDYAKEKTNCNY